MIISGGSRSNWRFFSKHLLRADENERVNVTEYRGLASDSVLEAFREMRDWTSVTDGRCKNFFYHANINPRADEVLTPEQWEQAVDTLEAELGLQGRARFVIEHEKDGRTHRHVVWSRIDLDTMKAVSDSHNYARHERAARALEEAFGHERVQGVHDREKDVERPDRRPENWETFRGHRSGIDPDSVKAELSDLWNRADSGKAFAAAIEERGYILTKGDKRDFVVIDQVGDSHSLARRIEGAKAKDIRERMADVDREALPTVAEGRARALAREDSWDSPVERNLTAQDDRPVNQERAEPIAAPSPAEVSSVSAFASAARDIMRDNAGDLHFLPNAATAAAKEAGEAVSAFQRFVNAFKDVMRAQDGHPVLDDGLSWWERTALLAAPLVSYIAEHVVDTALGYWQRFVTGQRSGWEPEPERDQGMDR